MTEMCFSLSPDARTLSALSGMYCRSESKAMIKPSAAETHSSISDSSAASGPLTHSSFSGSEPSGWNLSSKHSFLLSTSEFDVQQSVVSYPLIAAIRAVSAWIAPPPHTSTFAGGDTSSADASGVSAMRATPITDLIDGDIIWHSQ